MAAASFLCIACSVAQEKESSLETVDFLTGYGHSKLEGKGNCQLTPLMCDFGFTLKPLLKKAGLDVSSLVQFQLEPYLAPIIAPDPNVELGVAFLLKVGLLPDTAKVQPYLKAGPGMSYMTLQTREQSTQFNFIEYLGAGVHYFFAKDTAATLEGRYRHQSNAGIDHPNSGINSYFILAGITRRF